MSAEITTHPHAFDEHIKYVHVLQRLRELFVYYRRELKRKGKVRVPPKSREWIEAKKERRKKQGKR